MSEITIIFMLHFYPLESISEPSVSVRIPPDLLQTSILQLNYWPVFVKQTDGAGNSVQSAWQFVQLLDIENETFITTIFVGTRPHDIIPFDDDN